MNSKHFRLGIWAATCISIGLATAYADGVDAPSIVLTAHGASTLICAIIVIAWLHARLKQSRKSKK